MSEVLSMDDVSIAALVIVAGMVEAYDGKTWNHMSVHVLLVSKTNSLSLFVPNG